MRKCWRSWRPTRWKLSPPCSLWRTNAPGQQKAVHGTLQPRQDPLRRVGPVSLPLAATRRRTRRAVALTSHGSGVWLLLRQRPGARIPAASAHGNSAPTPGRALFILWLATAPPSAARAKNSRSTSARGVTKLQGKALPSAAVQQGEGLRRQCGRDGEGIGVSNPQQRPQGSLPPVRLRVRW
jgi:hypothetical protein